jgi:hypothetical protein
MGNEFVTITSPDVGALVRRIRANADSKAIRRDLNAGLKKVSTPVSHSMEATIPSALPRRGGLAALIRGATQVKVSTRGGSPGVSLAYRASGHDIRLLVGKRLWHPVYGNRAAGVTQTAGVHPEVFSASFAAQKPRIQAEVVKVLNDIARKVT